MDWKTCIICRLTKDSFNDEHVIPEALGGYYHIESVCIDCNSKMGELVDGKLVNHFFSKLSRYSLNLKGKNGYLPDPIAGEGPLEDEQGKKVRLVKVNGVYEPYILPFIDARSETNGFKITIDKKDEHLIPGIIEKIARRKNLPKEALRTISYKETETVPTLSQDISIDIREFKLGLLKIAYEYAIDRIPEYFNDKLAINIAEILYSGDVSRLDEIRFSGTGFDKEAFGILKFFLDLDNAQKHYLVLMSSEGLGTSCLINLFSNFYIRVFLSDISYLKEGFCVGINDIKQKAFSVYTALDIYNTVYSRPEMRFNFEFSTDEEARRFIKINKREGYYTEGGLIPFFDKHGAIVYSDVWEKAYQEHLIFTDRGDIEYTKEEIVLDEELYLKYTNSNHLFKVHAVMIERRLIRKV